MLSFLVKWLLSGAFCCFFQPSAGACIMKSMLANVHTSHLCTFHLTPRWLVHRAKCEKRDSTFKNICCSFTAILWTKKLAASLNKLLLLISPDLYLISLQMCMQCGFYRSNLSSLTCDLASVFCDKPQTRS